MGIQDNKCCWTHCSSFHAHCKDLQFFLHSEKACSGRTTVRLWKSNQWCSVWLSTSRGETRSYNCSGLSSFIFLHHSSVHNLQKLHALVQLAIYLRRHSSLSGIASWTASQILKSFEPLSLLIDHGIMLLADVWSVSKGHWADIIMSQIGNFLHYL